MDIFDKENLTAEIYSKLEAFGKGGVATERAVAAAVDSFFSKYSGLIFSGKALAQTASQNGFLISQEKAVLLMENALLRFRQESELEITDEFMRNVKGCADAIDLFDNAALTAFARERGRVFSEDDADDFRRKVAGLTREEAELKCLDFGASVAADEKQTGKKI